MEYTIFGWNGQRTHLQAEPDGEKFLIWVDEDESYTPDVSSVGISLPLEECIKLREELDNFIKSKRG